MEQGDFAVSQLDGWVYALNIPIFDEHERDGIIFDEARLTLISKNCNARISDTGDECPLVAGHAPKDMPEDQSTVLGWASNFRVREWGKVEPRACIFADFKFPKDKWETAKELPRRSVELWEPDKDTAFIDPIALLARSTPNRDLGLLYKKSEEKRRYTYQMTGGSVDQKEIVETFAKCLEESDIGKWVRNQMKADEAEADEPDAEQKHDDDDDIGIDWDATDRDAAADKDKEGEDDDKEPEKLRNQRDQARRMTNKLEGEVKLLAS